MPNSEFRILNPQSSLLGPRPSILLHPADRIVHLFQGAQIGAAELATTKGNAWGLLNAATQHIDHEAGRSADARLKSAWFGHGEAVKRRLLARLLQLRGS